MKIAINKKYGGFGLSQIAYERLIELGMKTSKKSNRDRSEPCIHEYNYEDYDLHGKYYMPFDYEMRSNSLLIQVIEELGDNVNDEFAKIEIVEIPDDIDYTIEDYDGIETIHECHQVW